MRNTELFLGQKVNERMIFGLPLQPPSMAGTAVGPNMVNAARRAAGAKRPAHARAPTPHQRGVDASVQFSGRALKLRNATSKAVRVKRLFIHDYCFLVPLLVQR